VRSDVRRDLAKAIPGVAYRPHALVERTPLAKTSSSDGRQVRPVDDDGMIPGPPMPAHGTIEWLDATGKVAGPA